MVCVLVLSFNADISEQQHTGLLVVFEICSVNWWGVTILHYQYQRLTSPLKIISGESLVFLSFRLDFKEDMNANISDYTSSVVFMRVQTFERWLIQCSRCGCDYEWSVETKVSY